MSTTRKHSRKRDAILRCIRSTTSHPTAEWVYRQLKPEFPQLSLGTVYRNLNLFCEQGEIASLGAVGGLERFDGNTEPHVHFICTNCGAVQDAGRLEIPREWLLRAQQAIDGKIDRWSLTLSGICQHCKSGECSPTE